MKTAHLALLILLLGAFFRLSGLARDSRLHPDEALYADLSRRVGIWGDWQLQDTPVDKPPLFYFTGGVFLRMLGDSEFTVRLPNAFASIIGLALMFAIARRLDSGQIMALAALLLLTLSPMDIAFATSGFTDTQMTVWMLAGFWLLITQRWGRSGLAFGLSVAVKPATLWFLPLMLAIGFIIQRPDRRMMWRWARSFLIVMVLISLWDRAGSLGSFWQLGAENYDGRRFVRADEIWVRAEIWWRWLRYTLPGGGILLAGLILALGKILVVDPSLNLVQGRQTTPTSVAQCATPFQPQAGGETASHADKPLPEFGEGLGRGKTPTTVFSLMLAFTLAYLGAHWLIAFNLFDRYLLPLTPIMALVVAYGIAETVKGRKMVTLAVLIVVLLIGVPLAWEASQGKTPIASDEGRHTGIDQLAAAMNRDFAGEIFYEHWLGWELRYYLGAEPQVLILYFESADDLAAYAADELARIPVPRYFVGPKNDATSWLDSIEAQGIQTEVVYDDGSYAIFSLDS